MERLCFSCLQGGCWEVAGNFKVCVLLESHGFCAALSSWNTDNHTFLNSHLSSVDFQMVARKQRTLQNTKLWVERVGRGTRISGVLFTLIHPGLFFLVLFYKLIFQIKCICSNPIAKQVCKLVVCLGICRQLSAEYYFVMDLLFFFFFWVVNPRDRLYLL